MSAYSNYCTTIAKVVQEQDLSSFKSHPHYQEILEHVNQKLGQDYLNLLTRVLDEHTISNFCTLNDCVGSPVKYPIGSYLCSPTSLRYLYHAHLVLTHIKKVNDINNEQHQQNIDIVEIGGGYGGLCLAMNMLQSLYNVQITSYKIIDLDEPLQLQKMYLDKFNLTFPVQFHHARYYGSDVDDHDRKDLFLIANYSFSEFSKEIQNEYLTHLFPKVSHGFLTWNCTKLYDIGKKVKIEEEVPQTNFNGTNYYVYF
jgi:hypothetical protein